MRRPRPFPLKRLVTMLVKEISMLLDGLPTDWATQLIPGPKSSSLEAFAAEERESTVTKNRLKLILVSPFLSLAGNMALFSSWLANTFLRYGIA